jgi:hypothetical protein
VSRVVIRPKLAVDIVIYFFDFSSLLTNGDSIVSANASVTLYSGTDPNPVLIFSSYTAAWNGPVASQYVTGGVTGSSYMIQMTVVSAGGARYSLSALLFILPSAT